jgi:DNA topoisomerase-1
MKYFRKKISEKKYKIVDKDDKVVEDKMILDYIESLVIPPAYDDVTIFYENAPKILFQGYDAKGRLQQIYSPAHKKKAMIKKFCSLLNFGKVLPQIKKDITKYINSKELTKEKIISLILQIVIYCGFRIGNIKYQKLYKSFGISNILKSHVKQVNKGLQIKFVGKKSVVNECIIDDAELIKEINILVDKKDNKSYIFTYINDGSETLITANDINNFLKAYDINTTSKHFRTWDVNILFIEYMRETDVTKLDIKQRKKTVIDALKIISNQVNNTPAICKKEYLHIDLLSLYLEQPIKYKKYFYGCDDARTCFIKFLEEFCQ